MDRLKENLEFIYDRNPFVQLLEMRLVQLESGKAVLTMPVVMDKHTNLHGIAHGGALASLADTAMGVACGTLGSKVVTVDMNINLMQGARPGGTISAKAEVLHHGKSTIVVDAGIFSEEGKLLAKSRGTFFVVGRFIEEDELD